MKKDIKLIAFKTFKFAYFPLSIRFFFLMDGLLSKLCLQYESRVESKSKLVALVLKIFSNNLIERAVT
jgi:hypothetical protein